MRLVAPVVLSNEPARPSQQIVSVDSATSKSCGARANVPQPENAFAEIIGQVSLPTIVGVTENNLTTDSVTAIVDRQLASNVLGSQQIPTFTAPSINLTEAEKKMLGLPDINKPLPWEAQLQTPTLVSTSLTTVQQSTFSGLSGVQQPTSALLGVQQPNPNVLSGSPDAHTIQQTLNPVEH